ncbi:SAM-dependent methyltransferase [Bacillus sp. OG2]|nr:SAM-dependent methyltransferase [Bacillus sp. OG2]
MIGKAGGLPRLFLYKNEMSGRRTHVPLQLRKKRSSDVKMDNFEEYDDPVLYDIENSWTGELHLLLELLEGKRGPVIDLACGTGRLAIPLAEKGFEVTGVDIHKGMLGRAAEKAKGLPIKWICGDVRSVDLDLKSGLVYMSGNSFQHFLTNQDQNRLLEAVVNHLDKSGLFIFDTRFPSAEELLQPEGEEYWKTITGKSGEQIKVSTISKYDKLTQIQHYQTIRRSDLEETVKNIFLRYTYPQEMERLLESCRLEIIQVYGGWDKRALTARSESLVYVCKLAEEA